MACPDGSYFDNLLKACASCMLNCHKCVQSFTCESCDFNYAFSLESGICQRQTGNAQPTVALIIGLSVLCAAILTICIVVCVRQRASRRATTNPTNEQSNANNNIQTETRPQNIEFASSLVQLAQNPDENCSICLQNTPNVVSTCKHQFHYSCFVNWYQREPRCPNCSTSHVMIKTLCSKCLKYSLLVKMCKKNCMAPDHSVCLQEQCKSQKCTGCANVKPQSLETTLQKNL